MKMKRLVAAILGVVIFGLGAWSPSTSTTNRPAPWDSVAEARRRPNAMRSRENGFLLKGGLGVNGCTDRWCHEVYPMLYLRFGAYYQFLKYMAAGVHLAFLFNVMEDDNQHDLTGALLDTFWNLVIGPEFKGIIPFGKFDLWGSVIFGYSRWGGSGEVPHPTDPQRVVDYDGWMHGFVLGWGFGMDYFLHPNMGIGFETYFYKPWYGDYCDEILGTSDCVDLSNWDRYDIGLWWSIGFVFTAWFGV